MWIAELLTNITNYINGVPAIKAKLIKSSNPLRIGILSAAAINPVALFDPVDSHPDILLVGIASRDKRKAEAQIAKYKRGAECKAYDSYDELLDDTSIDAVYIPLPNGLHFPWAVKALRKGKHVLVEKPITSNAEQVRELREVSEETGKVVLEAFHWRFHPARHYVKELCEGGKYGRVLSVKARLSVPPGALAKDDIRLSYKLGGGASMDLCYAVSAACYFGGATKDSDFVVKEASARISKVDPNIDEAMLATTEIKTPGRDTVTVTTDADLSPPWIWGIIPNFYGPSCIIELEKATIRFENFVLPTAYHDITITHRQTKKRISQKRYIGDVVGEEGEVGVQRGAEWWSTYRWQLDAFARKIGGEEPEEWVGLDESELVMRFIDDLYVKSGLPKRE